LFGHCAPRAQRIFGFTLTWFLLGIGFFPAVWCISFYFIRRSIRLEEEVAEVAGGSFPPATILTTGSSRIGVGGCGGKMRPIN
jgi:hypothetical protein